MKHQLDFEKPIIELQRKLDELKKHPVAPGLSFDDEVAQIQRKIAATRQQVYTNLTAWQRVQLARHPKRPFTLDYFTSTFTGFSEIHGDRLFAEDRAIVDFTALVKMMVDADLARVAAEPPASARLTAL